jgi:hypothetical protein
MIQVNHRQYQVILEMGIDFKIPVLCVWREKRPFNQGNSSLMPQTETDLNARAQNHQKTQSIVYCTELASEVKTLGSICIESIGMSDFF